MIKAWGCDMNKGWSRLVASVNTHTASNCVNVCILNLKGDYNLIYESNSCLAEKQN